VTRFWLGRSVARRLLGVATTEKAGKDIIQRRNRRPLLAENFLNAKRRIFHKRTEGKRRSIRRFGFRRWHNLLR
jgi:hypothetical protein